jgi:adenosine deaminase
LDRSSSKAVVNVEALPKVDLHRHLEGSLRVKTLLDVAQQHSLTLPMGIMRLDRMVQVQKGEPYTFENFLAKFNVLRLFYRSPEVIARVTSEAIEDAAIDKVRYLELRFTPVALSRAERFPLSDVVDWVCEAARDASRKFGLPVRLIVSVNRHESPELAEQVAWIAAERQDKGIVGMDLAGNEAEFLADPFTGIFREANQSGLRLTIHAGEWAGAQNVRDAIEKFGAERIGHGVRVMEDDYTVALARERGIVFEVCLTSNYQTGVIPELTQHPICRMLDAGLDVTLNTDDPSISQITLGHEYRVAVEELGLEPALLKQRILAAAQASFLPEAERARLVDQLKKQLSR